MKSFPLPANSGKALLYLGTGNPVQIRYSPYFSAWHRCVIPWFLMENTFVIARKSRRDPRSRQHDALSTEEQSPSLPDPIDSTHPAPPLPSVSDAVGNSNAEVILI